MRKRLAFLSIALAIPNRFLQSGPFIWVTSKYLGSCWYYRKTKVTLFDHSASTGPYFRSLLEKLLLNKVEGEKNRRSCESVFLCVCVSKPSKMIAKLFAHLIPKRCKISLV